ncbi:hypothetical protein BpHYR1_036775 [Brachionus plicatilis]|uniref:Uncharacterized protein n=1 Tax=Brachionus plicatilis TaxID=10195 RepID=A0A3M7SZL8_BRAPC|nr:hypothetical protein BpHYR1_036775 [Brachionus plicatilis]
MPLSQFFFGNYHNIKPNEEQSKLLSARQISTLAKDLILKFMSGLMNNFRTVLFLNKKQLFNQQ